MVTTWISFLIFSAICLVLTLVICLNAQRIGKAFGLLDIPDNRKHHSAITPLMGGVALIIVLIPLSLWHIISSNNTMLKSTLLVTYSLTFIMTILGLADDRHNLGALNRLLITFAVFLLAAVTSHFLNVRVIDFEFLPFDFGLGSNLLSFAFTVMCLAGLINSINMADGKNGLVIGLCLGWTILLSLRAPDILLPLLLLLGVMLFVLLLFNLNDRLFLGDGGSYGLASLIGFLTIIIYNMRGEHAGRAISADEIVVLFLIPVGDFFRLVFVRLIKGMSPMTAGRDHLHHHLKDNYGWPCGLYIYYIVALVPPFVLFVHY